MLAIGGIFESKRFSWTSRPLLEGSTLELKVVLVENRSISFILVYTCLSSVVDQFSSGRILFQTADLVSWDNKSLRTEKRSKPQHKHKKSKSEVVLLEGKFQYRTIRYGKTGGKDDRSRGDKENKSNGSSFVFPGLIHCCGKPKRGSALA